MKGILESIKQDGVTYDFTIPLNPRTARDIQERGGIQTVNGVLPTDQIPAQSEDPSFIILKTTPYAVDTGFKLPDDVYTTGHNSDHCWTETYWVESEIVYDDWSITGYAADCNGTSSCSVVTANLGQSCKAHTYQWDNTLALNFDAHWEVVANKFTVGFLPGYTHSETQANTDTICTTDSGSV